MDALPEEDDPARAVLVRVEAPAAEEEAAAAGVEVQRGAGLPTGVGGAVVDQDLVVARHDLRVDHVGHGRVDRTRERESLRELLDHLTVSLDTEALQRRREQDADHRSLAHRVDELLVPALLHHADLTDQLALAVVVELPPGELRRVGALDRHKEDVLERATVVGDRDLGQDDRQPDAASKVLHLLLVVQLGEQHLHAPLKLRGGDEHHLREELRDTHQHHVVVDLRLHEVELAVGVHRLTLLEAGRRDAAAVLIDQRLRGITTEDDLVITVEDGLEGLFAAVLTATGEEQLAQQRLLLTTLETAHRRFERHLLHDPAPQVGSPGLLSPG